MFDANDAKTSCYNAFLNHDFRIELFFVLLFEKQV